MLRKQWTWPKRTCSFSTVKLLKKINCRINTKKTFSRNTLKLCNVSITHLWENLSLVIGVTRVRINSRTNNSSTWTSTSWRTNLSPTSAIKKSMSVIRESWRCTAVTWFGRGLSTTYRSLYWTLRVSLGNPRMRCRHRRSMRTLTAENSLPMLSNSRTLSWPSWVSGCTIQKSLKKRPTRFITLTQSFLRYFLTKSNIIPSMNHRHHIPIKLTTSSTILQRWLILIILRHL